MGPHGHGRGALDARRGDRPVHPRLDFFVERRRSPADNSVVLIREEVQTRVTPERAWELLSDPALHSLWNPRIVATEVSGAGPPGLGFQYRVTYELAGRRDQFDAEVTEFSPPVRFSARLKARAQVRGQSWNRGSIESYTIEPRRDGVRVRHEIRVDLSGANGFLQLLTGLLSRLGPPQGDPFLERFREVAEDEGEERKTSLRRAA